MKKIFNFFLLIFLFYSGSVLSKESVLFIGSSTIYYWKDRIANDFPNIRPINEGSLGATYIYLSNQIPYYVAKYSSIKKIVVYAGDNDIAIPFNSPRKVANDCKNLMINLHHVFPEAHILVISIKPCPAYLIRASTQTVLKTNLLIMEIINKLNLGAQLAKEKSYISFVDIFPKMLNAYHKPDCTLFSMPLGIHLNNKGYALWAKTLLPWIKQ